MLSLEEALYREEKAKDVDSVGHQNRHSKGKRQIPWFKVDPNFTVVTELKDVSCLCRYNPFIFLKFYFYSF